MIGMTHGQPATPTTFGKEINVFRARLHNTSKAISLNGMKVKWGGAVGNLAGLHFVDPWVDWPTICDDFVRSINPSFSRDNVTTQIVDRNDISSKTLSCK